MKNKNIILYNNMKVHVYKYSRFIFTVFEPQQVHFNVKEEKVHVFKQLCNGA